MGDPIASRDTWWVNRFTKERAWLPGYQRAYRSEFVRSRRGGHSEYKAIGRHVERLILIPEGRECFPLWYTKRELRAVWAPLRLRKDTTYIPDWIRRAPMQDYLLSVGDEDPVWVALQRIRSGWFCLSAIVQDEVTNIRESKNPCDPEKKLWEHSFDWSLQRYNTFFLPAAEAIPRLTPKFHKIPFTVYDRINEAADEEEEDIPPPPRSEPQAVGRIAHLREVLDVKIRPRKKKAS